MGSADTSAYLLIAAGVFWLLMGVIGLMGVAKSSDDTVNRTYEDPGDASNDERRRLDRRLNTQLPNE